MSYILEKLNGVKLSLQSYALATSGIVVAGLLIALKYKNQQVHKLHVDVLKAKYSVDNKQAIDKMFQAQDKAASAYDNYTRSKREYEVKWGKL